MLAKQAVCLDFCRPETSSMSTQHTYSYLCTAVDDWVEKRTE